MDWTAHLNAMLTAAGQDVTLGGSTRQAIFDRAYQVAEVGLGVASTQPALTCRTADVPVNPVGQTVVVSGTTWRIAEHRPDGTGVSVLLLEAS